MLNHSSKMETQVFMPQESSTTSKANPEPKGIQSMWMRLMLLLISVLVLLLVGMIALYIWMCLYPTVERINPEDCTQRHIFNITLSNLMFIFKVQRSGTYFIYGEVPKPENEKANNGCKDVYRLCWQTDCKNLKMYFSTEAQEPRIVATDVELQENAEVFLQNNCNADKGSYIFRVVQLV